jgi:geranylgeranyl diphosphate synthase, type I
MGIGSVHPLAAGSGAGSADFTAALAERRRWVYDYLLDWPGADAFRPADIHDGLLSYVRHAGKGLRPCLLLLSCGAAGGDEKQALPAAAAVEIYHIWTLVHDDIIDRDDTRRGHPTVHSEYGRRARDERSLSDVEAAHYGTAVAILAGDLQQSWAYALLTDLAARGVEGETILKLVRRMATELTPQLLEGEMLDVQFAHVDADSLTEQEVISMLSKKTAALTEYAAWAGATIGLAGQLDSSGLAEKLGRFAYLCGTAFQLQDDILGLTADEGILGKAVGADLREGKRTLVLYRALANATPDERRLLLSVVGRADASAEEIRGVLSIIGSTRAIAQISQMAHNYVIQAIELLSHVPESKYRTLLEQFAKFVLARSH